MQRECLVATAGNISPSFDEYMDVCRGFRGFRYIEKDTAKGPSSTINKHWRQILVTSAVLSAFKLCTLSGTKAYVLLRWPPWHALPCTGLMGSHGDRHSK